MLLCFGADLDVSRPHTYVNTGDPEPQAVYSVLEANPLNEQYEQAPRSSTSTYSLMGRPESQVSLIVSGNVLKQMVLEMKWWSSLIPLLLFFHFAINYSRVCRFFLYFNEKHFCSGPDCRVQENLMRIAHGLECDSGKTNKIITPVLFTLHRLKPEPIWSPLYEKRSIVC